MQRRKGGNSGGQRVSLSRRKENVIMRRGGCRVRGSAGVRVGGFTVSHSCHHLDCGIL